VENIQTENTIIIIIIIITINIRIVKLFSRETPCAQQEQAKHFISCQTPAVLSYSTQQS